MNSLLSAVRFLTILPLGSANDTDLNLGKSLAFFPLVGAAVGLVSAGIGWILLLVFPSSVANILVVVALLALRGGLHQDGLMDTADGLFSQKDRLGALEVMRDSRVGTFGAIALVFSLLLKWSVLNQLGPALAWRALVLAPAIGEWSIVYSAQRYPYARADGGKGKIFAEQAALPQLAVASLTALGLAVLVLGSSVWPILVVVPLTAGTAAYIARRLGGLTGDTYGAIGEAGEIMGFLLVLAALQA